VSNITGLNASTTYYVRAYATNSAGTAYGAEDTFTTASSNSGGSVTYPEGTVHCTGTPTEVVDVTNPTTGKTWMDRNLGASQVATSSTDADAYGDLYQWGRRADGHQCRNSSTRSTLSSTDEPGHGYFIINESSPDDWRSPQNDNLWQGVNGINNPCPSGYRIPTSAELDAELASWSSDDAAGAFASTLKLTMASWRFGYDGLLEGVGSRGGIWSSTVVGTEHSASFRWLSHNAIINYERRANGISVRCTKDELPTITTVSVTSITDSSAGSGGTIVTNGSSSITARGVVWSTWQTPTLTSNLGATNDGSGTGIFTSNLTSLSLSTTYYVRAYATNSEVTAYGNEVSFTTTAGGGGGSGAYPDGTVHCTGTPTEIVDVTNPTTGKTWMDRNLGASQAATSITDSLAYGDLYQWGRGADGHQCRNSSATSTLSSTDDPGHGNFITSAYESNNDWRSPQNDNLWQGENGTNNPCPDGYRLPTKSEWEEELATWVSDDAAGAFASPLKLPVADYRSYYDGSLSTVWSSGYYWSSMVRSNYQSYFLIFSSSNALVSYAFRASGYSVRCLKD
jgi:uncharacterized protein (TIGR02145 family)